MNGDKLLSVDEFASKIKQQYPQYKDIDNFELAQKIIDKYPSYADQVDLKKKEDGEDGAPSGVTFSASKRNFNIARHGDVMAAYDPTELSATGEKYAREYQEFVTGAYPAIHQMDQDRIQEIEQYKKDNPVVSDSRSQLQKGVGFVSSTFGGTASGIATMIADVVSPATTQADVDEGVKDINSKYNLKYKRDFLDDAKKKILKEAFGVEDVKDLSDKDKFAAQELSDYYMMNYGLDLQLDNDDRYEEDFFLNDTVNSLGAGLIDFVGAINAPMTAYGPGAIAGAIKGMTPNEYRKHLYDQTHSVANGLRDLRTKYSEESSGMTQAFQNGHIYSGTRQLVSGVAEAIPQVAAAVALGATGVGAPASMAILGTVGASSHFHQTENEDNQLIAEGRADEVQYDTVLKRAGASLIMGTSDALMTGILGGLGKAARGASSEASKEIARGMFKQLGISATEGAIEEAGAEIAIIAYDAALGKPITKDEFIKRVIDSGSIGALMPAAGAPMASIANRSNAALNSRSEKLKSIQEADPETGKKEDKNQTKAFFQMLAVRHPKSMARINQIDLHIENLVNTIKEKKKSVQIVGKRVTKVDLDAQTQETGVEKSIDTKVQEEIKVLENKLKELESERNAIKSQYADEDLTLTDSEIKTVRRDFVNEKTKSLQEELRVANEEISNMEEEQGGEGFDYAALDEAKTNRDQLSQKLADVEDLIESIDKTQEKIDEAEDLLGTEDYDPRSVEGFYNDLEMAQKDLADVFGFKLESTQLVDTDSGKRKAQERQEGRKQIKESQEEIISAKDAASRANAVKNFENAASKDNPVTQEEIDAADKAKQDLVNEGYVIDNITEGQMYAENTDADVEFIDDDTIAEGVQFVEEVVKPEVVDSEGNKIQKATVKVRRGTAESAERSAIQNNITKAEEAGNSKAVIDGKKALEDFDEGAAYQYMRKARTAPVLLKKNVKQEPVKDSDDRGIKGQYKDYRANKDGTLGITPDDKNKLTPEETKSLNRILGQVIKVFGGSASIRIHNTIESGNKSAKKNKGNNIIEGLFTSDARTGEVVVHVNMEAIRNSIKEQGLKGKAARNYLKKVLTEESTHATLSTALRELFNNNPEQLKQLMDKFLKIVKKDSALAKIIEGKAVDYEAAGYDEGGVMDEVISEIISSVSSGLNAADVSTINQIRIWINQVLQSVYGKAGKEMFLDTDESVISVLAKFKNMVDSGEYISMRDKKSNDAERASLKKESIINPTKLPEDSEFEVVYYQQGFDFVSKVQSKKFNGKWHFINWWNKATENGQSDKLHTFRLIESEGVRKMIDVDSMKKWNLKKPTSYAQRKNVAKSKEDLRTQTISSIKDMARKARKDKTSESEFAEKSYTAYDNDFLTENYKEFFEGVDLSKRENVDNAIKELPQDKADELLDKLTEDAGESSDNGVTERAYFSAKSVLLDRGKQMDMDNFTNLRKRVMCGLGAKACKSFKKSSELEFLGHLTDQVLGKNATDSERSLLLSRFLEVGIPQVIEKTGLDVRNFYNDYESGRSMLLDTFSKDPDIPTNVAEFAPVFDTLVAIFSNGQKSFKNINLAANVFYHSMRNVKAGHDSNIIPSTLIRKIQGKDNRYDLGSVRGQRRKAIVSNLNSANRLFAQHFKDTGSFDGASFFKLMSQDGVNANGSETGLRAMQTELGDATFKIGGFALNLMGDKSAFTADAHVHRHIGIVKGKGAEMVDDLQFMNAKNRNSVSKFLIEEMGVNPKDIVSDKDLIAALVEAKKDPENGSKAKTKYADIFMADPYKKGGRSQYVLDQRLVKMTVDSYNRNMGLEGDDALTMRDAGQAMYALGQLAVTEYKGRFEYTPYKPDIEKVLQTESYKDLSNIDKQAELASEKADEDIVLENAELAGFKATDRIVNANDHPLYRERGVSALEFKNTKTEKITQLSDGIVKEALDTDKVSRQILAKNNKVEVGDKVGIRLNLNVKSNTGVPVQTVHDKGASGDVLTYAGAVVVKNAKLFVSPNARKKIALFQESKFPMASVNGEFVTGTVSEANLNGVKAIFNPLNHAAFVDVSGRPIKSAEEATIVGSNVFLRGKIEYYEYDDPRLLQGMLETPKEKTKRVKRGNDYDTAVRKFEAYQKKVLKDKFAEEYDSKEALQEAYDEMPLASQVALDDSEVADRMLENMERASIANNRKRMRQTAKRGANIAGLSSAMSNSIRQNPENYITPQRLSDVRDKLDQMSSADLMDTLKDDALREIGESDSPISGLAGAELINRHMKSGDQSEIPLVLERLAKKGTSAGRILRQLAELKSSTPAGLMETVISAVEARGNMLNESQTGKLARISKGMFETHRELNDLIERIHNGEDVTKQITEKTEEHRKFVREMETFTNQVVERGFFSLGRQFLQGNLLTMKSQAVNVLANIVNLGTMLPRDIIAYPIQKAINAFRGKDTVKRQVSLDAYFHGAVAFGKGFIDSLQYVFTGNEKNDLGGTLAEWRMDAGFAPMRSLVAAFSKGALPLNADGSEKGAISKQRAKLFIQGTFGLAPEIMFRLLDLGDRPFRQAVQTIDLHKQAKALGLEGNARRNFVKYPNKKARETSAREGAKATFQEDTALSRAAMKIVSGIPKLIPGVRMRELVDFIIRSQTPYVKTPANIVAETLTYAVAPIAVARAARSIRKGDSREASQHLAKAAIGGMVGYAAAQLVLDGIISGAIDWDDDEEKNLAYAKFPPNTINVSALRRKYFDGDEDGATFRDDDEFWSYDQMGIIGAVMGAHVKGIEDAKEATEDPFVTNRIIREALGMDAFSGAAHIMDQGFLTGTDNLIQVIGTLRSGREGSSERAFEKWFDDTFRALSAVPLPNTLAQINRAQREYMPDQRVNRGDNFQERIAHRARYIINDRTFGHLGGDFPVRVDWKGEPIKQTPEGADPFFYNMFDIRKARQGESDPVSNEIYRLFEETEEIPAVIGTPSFASRRDVSVPDLFKFDERTGRLIPISTHAGPMIRALGRGFENRLTFLKDKEFVAGRVKLTTEQINNVMAIAGRDRYSRTLDLIKSTKYQRMSTEDKVKAMNELDEKYYSKVLSYDNRKNVLPHTITLLEMIQEQYENERED